jgi:hypothetical protein
MQVVAQRADRAGLVAAGFRARLQEGRRRALSHPLMGAQSAAGLALTSFATAAVAAAVEAALRPQPEPVVAAAPEWSRAGRQLSAASALLAASALADSAVEHYRGSFHNRTMLLPLAVAGLSLAANLVGAADGSGRPSSTRELGHAAALATGLFVTGFHIYNVLKRPGGWSWLNLYYAAPLGAPASLSLAGMLGGIADRLCGSGQTLYGCLPGRLGARLVALGLLGASGEAALLHFRGAYHKPGDGDPGDRTPRRRRPAGRSDELPAACLTGRAGAQSIDRGRGARRCVA